MEKYELKRLYEQNEPKDTILAAYREIVAEKGTGKKYRLRYFEEAK